MDSNAGNVPQGPNGAPPPQKLVDFNNDLQALCAKYQYELKAVLRNDSFSIYAALQVFDVSPKVATPGVPLNPKKGQKDPAKPQLSAEGVDNDQK